MKKQNLYIAQKAVVFKKENNKVYLLLIKYKEAPKKNTFKVEGKYGCPGGKIQFGEKLDESLKRECLEETGILIEPQDPIGIISWQVEKEEEQNQIVAIFRLCLYKEGTLKNEVNENDTKLEGSYWMDISDFNIKNNLIGDEVAIIEKALDKIKN
jgi:ADP-ribose pyrophosphatase YjhB (NUDIX family)